MGWGVDQGWPRGGQDRGGGWTGYGAGGGLGVDMGVDIGEGWMG